MSDYNALRTLDLIDGDMFSEKKMNCSMDYNSLFCNLSINKNKNRNTETFFFNDYDAPLQITSIDKISLNSTKNKTSQKNKKIFENQAEFFLLTPAVDFSTKNKSNSFSKSVLKNRFKCGSLKYLKTFSENKTKESLSTKQKLELKKQSLNKIKVNLSNFYIIKILVLSISISKNISFVHLIYEK